MRDSVRRAIEQERELDHTLMQRELQTPTPSVATGRGVPAVNALQVRVTHAYDGARAGTGKWSNVSIRDAHKPPTTLRNLRPRAETPCISTMPDGTTKVFTPARSERQRSYKKQPNVSTENHNVQNITPAERIALLASVQSIGNVD